MIKPIRIGNKEIRIPIIQGGMGVGISLSGLASAVANEGGVGVISCAGIGLLHKQSSKTYLENCIYGLKEELRKARKKTKGIIGVNIMVALSNFEDMVCTAIKEKVDIIFAGAGLPLNLPSFLTSNSNTQLVPIVSSARAAKVICEKWKTNYNYLPDAIVVEGPKAGGHLGFKKKDINAPEHSLEQIIPQVCQVVKSYQTKKNIPVIAAGGISTGRDILDLIKLGATGVQIGSLFVPTTECDASSAFKEVYVNSSQSDMLIIQSPVGMPGRAINSPFIQSVNAGKEQPKSCPYNCIKTCDYAKSPYCIIKALYNAAKGNLNKGYAFAGANAYLTQKIRSVKEVIATLKKEFDIAEEKL